MKVKIPPVLRKIVFYKDVEKIVVVILAVVLAGLTVVLTLKSREGWEEDELSALRAEFVIPAGDREEAAFQQRVIEQWEKPEEFPVYAGILRRDFFTEHGRTESGGGGTGFLSLTLLYQGSILIGEDLKAQINWQEGKKLKTYLVRTGESVRGYEILEVIPGQTVRMKSPEGEEIVLEYKKEFLIEKITGDI